MATKKLSTLTETLTRQPDNAPELALLNVMRGPDAPVMSAEEELEKQVFLAFLERMDTGKSSLELH